MPHRYPKNGLAYLLKGSVVPEKSRLGQKIGAKTVKHSDLSILHKLYKILMQKAGRQEWPT